jgi:hypothetical protein
MPSRARPVRSARSVDEDVIVVELEWNEFMAANPDAVGVY